MMRHDLLEEPLLTWRDSAGHRARATLPGALARVSSGELADFPRLRPHQLHPWMMFLTQLAAIALHRGGVTDPPCEETPWRRALLDLTMGSTEPWALVVDDLSKPAFFQPPIPEGDNEGWSTCEFPDDLDILVTAKAHDVKTSMIPCDDIEAWVYAVVTLQTTQGYPGRGYNGIARMNGGYGSRPRVGLSPDQTLSSRFRRDVAVLLSSWPDLLRRGYRDEGVSLVWAEPWDGSTSLPMDGLAPHFIEICWRIRCEDESGVTARYTTTRVRRCLPEVDNGDTGDPWAPVERDKGVLSVSGRGFHYVLLSRLLFGSDFEEAAAQILREGDPAPVLFLASALARGQGKTDGLHERSLLLGGRACWHLGRPDTRAAAGRRAAARVISAQTMRSKVLYPALKQLFPESEVKDEFEARVDDDFFDHLFATLDDDDDQARLAWERRLIDLGRAELDRGLRRFSVPTAQSWRAISAAESIFSSCVAKNFPDSSQDRSFPKEGPFR